MKNVKLMISALALAASVTQVSAETLRYNHNGSAMLVEWSGKNLTIRYDNPRSSLRKHGVKRGTLLFSGKLDKLDNGTPYVDGDARIFRQGCSPTPYFVYGEIRKGKNFQLAGAAPVLAKGGCRIVDNSHTSTNAKLVFTVVKSQSNNQSNSKPNKNVRLGWSELCVTGVQSSLNLRTGPGSSYGRIGTLPANACDVVALNQCINGWCAVQRNIEIGWASSTYLRKR